MVLTMYDPRNNLSGQVEEDVRTHLGERVYKTVIPRNVRISEAPSFGQPALLYDHKCAGSQAICGFELIQRGALNAELIAAEGALEREKTMADKKRGWAWLVSVIGDVDIGLSADAKAPIKINQKRPPPFLEESFRGFVIRCRKACPG